VAIELFIIISTFLGTWVWRIGSSVALLTPVARELDRESVVDGRFPACNRFLKLASTKTQA
jgi:hypothetical protein